MYTFRQACVLYDVRDVKGVFNRADPHLCVFIWIWRHVKMSLVSWSSWWEESKTDRLGLFIWQNNGLLLSVHWLSVSSSVCGYNAVVFSIIIHWYNCIFLTGGCLLKAMFCIYSVSCSSRPVCCCCFFPSMNTKKYLFSLIQRRVYSDHRLSSSYKSLIKAPCWIRKLKWWRWRLSLDNELNYCSSHNCAVWTTFVVLLQKFFFFFWSLLSVSIWKLSVSIFIRSSLFEESQSYRFGKTCG